MKTSKEDQNKIEEVIKDKLDGPLCCCCKQNPAVRKDYRDNSGCLSSCPVCEECFHLNHRDFWELKNRTNYPPVVVQGVCGGMKKVTFKCEWCGEQKSQAQLYSWTGYLNWIGPICRECVVIRQPCYHGSEYCRENCQVDDTCPALCTGFPWKGQFLGVVYHLTKENKMNEKVENYIKNIVNKGKEIGMKILETTSKFNPRCHEQVEVEEVHKEEEEKTRTEHEEYTKRKHKYAKHIMGELEAFLLKRAEDWKEDEEHELIDILSFVENLIKAQLSANDEKYKG